jgi:Raf kinase inhibitor-like YbhB/YbcL family protein
MRGNWLIWVIVMLAALSVAGGAYVLYSLPHGEILPPPAPVTAPPVKVETPVAKAPETAPIQPAQPQQQPAQAKTAVPKIILTGRELTGVGGKIALKYTCFRQNISPAFSWQGIPPEAKSLMLILERRDKGARPFVNWIVFDIPPALTGIGGNLEKTPTTVEGLKQALNDNSSPGYSGPCEREGEHTYLFRLFALDIETGLPAGTPRNALVLKMKGHVLAEGDVPVVHYYRK